MRMTIPRQRLPAVEVEIRTSHCHLKRDGDVVPFGRTPGPAAETGQTPSEQQQEVSSAVPGMAPAGAEIIVDEQVPLEHLPSNLDGPLLSLSSPLRLFRVAVSWHKQRSMQIAGGPLNLLLASG